MNPIWNFIIVITIIAGFSVIGGKRLLKYFEDRSADDAPKFLMHGILAIVGGMIIAISTFLIFSPEGKTSVTVPESGAFQKNKDAQPEPTKAELDENSKEKKEKEYGKEQTYEEIRDQSNKIVEEAVKRNQ